jgi:glutathione peroxidase-family protein
MRALPDVKVQRLTGETLPLPELKGQWLLISVSGGDCQADCQQQLYLQRQILTGLGKERARTEWVWLLNDQAEVPSSIMPGLKEATVLRMSADAVAQWLQPTQGQQLKDHLYLVDPHGQWMMRFPAKLSAEGALKAKRDIERLLRAAAAWDEAGR